MSEFIEITERYYNEHDNEYKVNSYKTSININHIISFGDNFIRTTEVYHAPSATTLVVETQVEIKQLIQQATTI